MMKIHSRTRYAFSLLFLVVTIQCSATRKLRRARDVTPDNQTDDSKSMTAKRQVFANGPLFAPAPTACGIGCPTFSPAVGCAPPVAALPPLPPPTIPFAAPAPPPPPVPAGRLIPQALPGAPCEPGVECTGGSVCSRGICLCPPELVQEGTVCVSRTIYGVGSPPLLGGPLPPLPPPSFAAFNPVPAPLPLYSPAVAAAPPAFGPCGPGFTPAFAPGFGGCVQKRNSVGQSFNVDIADSEEQGQ